MKVKADIEKKLLSIGEAADYLGVSIDTLRRWEKREKVKVLRSPGGHRYFKKEELDSLFGSKYERDETENLPDEKITKQTDTYTSDKPVTTPIDITEEKVERPKLVVPRYIINQRISKYDVLFANKPRVEPEPAVKSETPATITIEKPVNTSVLEPEIKQPQAKKTSFSLSSKISLVIITILVITAFVIYLIISSSPKVLSPIP